MALYLTNGYTITIPSSPITFVGQGLILGIPASAVFALAAVIGGGILLNRTRTGVHITASGANESSLVRSGVNVAAVKYVVYILSSVAASLAGVIYTGQLASGSADIGSSFELTVIAGVILGGTDLFGGSGTIFGTVIGMIIIEMVSDALVLFHVSPSLTQVSQGLILLLAILLNMKIEGIRSYLKIKPRTIR